MQNLSFLCIHYRKHESSFYIAAGIIDSSDLPDAIYVVDKVIIDDFQNLALIKLQDPLTFSNKINKINIPSKNMNIIDTSVVVPGWGSVTKVNIFYYVYVDC